MTGSTSDDGAEEVVEDRLGIAVASHQRIVEGVDTVSETSPHAYEVFAKVGKPLRPILHLGSVRAVDPEFAWIGAKEAFTRRDDCLLLWVIPRPLILMGSPAHAPEGVMPDDVPGECEPELYEAFAQYGAEQELRHVGTVTAADPQEAWRLALEAHVDEGDVEVLWVAAQDAIVANRPGDAAMGSGGRKGYAYRLPQFPSRHRRTRTEQASETPRGDSR